MSAADAANVVLDAPDQVNAVVLLGLVAPGGWVADDGTVDLDALRSALAARLAEDAGGELRRLRQRVGTERRRPVWLACQPDLTWHVRLADATVGTEDGAGSAGATTGTRRPGLTGAPGPTEGTRGPGGASGADRALARLAARLAVTPLPMDRPLWELLVIPPGPPVPSGDTPTVAIALRLHHALADGVAAVRLVGALAGPAGQHTTGPAPASTPPTPRAWSLRTIARSCRRRLGPLTLGVARVSAMVRVTVAPTVLLGAISPERGVILADVDLARLAAAARAAGGTVNDALLAAVVQTAEAVLAAAGEAPPAAVPASVPVALPDRGRSGNATGVMRVALPTGEPDPARRVARIAPLTRAEKAAARAQGTFELTRSRWATVLFGRLARRQRFITTFVSNVPGPARPLSLAGAPLVAAWPVAPLQGNVRFAVTAFSYAGRLWCAAHLDAGALDATIAQAALAGALEAVAASDETRPGDPARAVP